jgi:NADPH:quinone reductase-like Zn-dependent oxidoreductase
MTVQLAVALGAEVSAACAAGDREFVAGLGAATVIDYAGPFADEAGNLDIAVDTVGGDTMHRSATVLRPGGILVCVAEPPDPGLASRTGIRASYFVVEPDRDQLTRLADLADTGKIRPVIAATYPLEQAADAYASIDHDYRRGKLVLEVRSGSKARSA